MGFVDSVKSCFSNYATFKGRASRSEYWWFALFLMLVMVALAFVDGSTAPGQEIGVLGAIFSLATLLPSLAVGARRLHDTDKSGGWLLLYILPLVGAIVLLIFFIIKGDEDENRFGPDPLASEE